MPQRLETACCADASIRPPSPDRNTRTVRSSVCTLSLSVAGSGVLDGLARTASWLYDDMRRYYCQYIEIKDEETI
jgi:hypothetical protein